MKRLFLIVLFLLAFMSVCFADQREIITEGTYIATETDSQIQAEDAALTIAKRAALEQAGTLVTSNTTVDMLNLKYDQIKSVSAAIMEITVLDKNRTFDGQSMTYYVKIKAVVKTDNIAESLANALKASERKIIGVIATFDTTPPVDKDNMDDLHTAKQNNKYNYADLEKDNNLMEPIKTAINEKYGTRHTTIEFVKDVPADSAAYAKEKGFDCIILSTLKFTKLHSQSDFMLFGNVNYWKIDGECTVKIYDADKNAEILNKTFISKIKQDISDSFGFMMSGPGIETGFNAGIVKLQNDIVGQMKSTLPSL